MLSGVLIAMLVVALFNPFALTGSLAQGKPTRVPADDPAVTPEATKTMMEIPRSSTEDGGFILGYDDAPVTIIEFADWACPHCQNYKPVIDQFIEEYVETGQAKFEFRVYPTAGGRLTLFAGLFAECVDEARPGAFWDAHDILYELAFDEAYDEELGQVVARELDLNYEDLLTCAAEDAESVLQTAELADDLGVGGTPAIAIRYGDGEARWIKFDGAVYDQGGVPFEVLAAVIEQANDDAAAGDDEATGDDETIEEATGDAA
jgi:protein-disulfide isomerase